MVQNLSLNYHNLVNPDGFITGYVKKVSVEFIVKFNLVFKNAR